MTEFVSEPINPTGGRFDLAAMSRAEPGLPKSFEWRGATYHIAARLEQWKHTSSEGGRTGGQVYLRRHYYRLRMSDGAVWTVYFTRQSSPGSARKARWFLYSLDEPAAPEVL